MVNVLMVLPRYLPIIGGAEIQCERLIKALGSYENVNITGVVTRRVERTLVKKELVKGVPVRRLQPGGTGVLSEYIFCVILFFYLIFKSKKYDIIHCHASSIFGIAVSLVGAIANKKVIVKVSTNGEVSAMQKGYFKKKIVLFASKYCTYIALNREGYEEVIECIPNANVSLIPNGIDFNYINNDVDSSIRRELEDKFGHDVFVCLFVGRLVARKGIKDLMSAASLLLKRTDKNFCFLFVGDGNLQRDAESFDSILKNDRVVMEGRKENITPYLIATDVFVSPSYNEGLPNTVLEALSCGKKCILSDIRPHLELKDEHPRYIRTFKSRDVEMLADCIDIESSTQEGLSPFDNVLIDKYDIKNVALRYMELYRGIK
ncbi:glycosyltransferase family 4 protein [Erwinia aphidicola]|uniref:glycosyltransferase family 4 protein n=1 Tax=Erwinia aphidicola TaxID=68334 RepID=UPI003CECE710